MDVHSALSKYLRTVALVFALLGVVLFGIEVLAAFGIFPVDALEIVRMVGVGFLTIAMVIAGVGYWKMQLWAPYLYALTPIEGIWFIHSWALVFSVPLVIALIGIFYFHKLHRPIFYRDPLFISAASLILMGTAILFGTA